MHMPNSEGTASAAQHIIHTPARRTGLAIATAKAAGGKPAPPTPPISVFREKPCTSPARPLQFSPPHQAYVAFSAANAVPRSPSAQTSLRMKSICSQQLLKTRIRSLLHSMCTGMSTFPGRPATTNCLNMQDLLMNDPCAACSPPACCLCSVGPSETGRNAPR